MGYDALFCICVMYDPLFSFVVIIGWTNSRSARFNFVFLLGSLDFSWTSHQTLTLILMFVIRLFRLTFLCLLLDMEI